MIVIILFLAVVVSVCFEYSKHTKAKKNDSKDRIDKIKLLRRING